MNTIKKNRNSHYLRREGLIPMPYIEKANRGVLLEGVVSPSNVGELNFVISHAVREYLGDEYNYQRINDVIGVLECAKQEAYRRIAVPYEDRKKELNGDVY